MSSSTAVIWRVVGAVQAAQCETRMDTADNPRTTSRQTYRRSLVSETLLTTAGSRIKHKDHETLLFLNPRLGQSGS